MVELTVPAGADVKVTLDSTGKKVDKVTGTLPASLKELKDGCTWQKFTPKDGTAPAAGPGVTYDLKEGDKLQIEAPSSGGVAAEAKEKATEKDLEKDATPWNKLPGLTDTELRKIENTLDQAWEDRKKAQAADKSKIIGGSNKQTLNDWAAELKNYDWRTVGFHEGEELYTTVLDKAFLNWRSIPGEVYRIYTPKKFGLEKETTWKIEGINDSGEMIIWTKDKWEKAVYDLKEANKGVVCPLPDWKQLEVHKAVESKRKPPRATWSDVAPQVPYSGFGSRKIPKGWTYERYNREFAMGDHHGSAEAGWRAFEDYNPRSSESMAKYKPWRVAFGKTVAVQPPSDKPGPPSRRQIILAYECLRCLGGGGIATAIDEAGNEIENKVVDGLLDDLLNEDQMVRPEILRVVEHHLEKKVQFDPSGVATVLKALSAKQSPQNMFQEELGYAVAAVENGKYRWGKISELMKHQLDHVKILNTTKPMPEDRDGLTQEEIDTLVEGEKEIREWANNVKKLDTGLPAGWSDDFAAKLKRQATAFLCEVGDQFLRATKLLEDRMKVDSPDPDFRRCYFDKEARKPKVYTWEDLEILTVDQLKAKAKEVNQIDGAQFPDLADPSKKIPPLDEKKIDEMEEPDELIEAILSTQVHDWHWVYFAPISFNSADQGLDADQKSVYESLAQLEPKNPSAKPRPMSGSAAGIPRTAEIYRPIANKVPDLKAIPEFKPSDWITVDAQFACTSRGAALLCSNYRNKEAAPWRTLKPPLEFPADWLEKVPDTDAPCLNLTSQEAEKVLKCLEWAWDKHAKDLKEHFNQNLSKHTLALTLPQKITYWFDPNRKLTPDLCEKRNRCLHEFFAKNKKWRNMNLECTILRAARRAIIKWENYKVPESKKEAAEKSAREKRAYEAKMKERLDRANPPKQVLAQLASAQPPRPKEKRLMRLWVD